MFKKNDISKCFSCFNENNNLIVEDKGVLFKFCQSCGSIFIYEKGIFGAKKTPHSRTNLRLIAGFCNMINDISSNSEDYKNILSNIIKIPTRIIDELFNDQYLVVDSNGLRTKDYDYLENKKFYTGWSDEQLVNEKIKIREMQKKENISNKNRILNNQFLPNEQVWVKI